MSFSFDVDTRSYVNKIFIPHTRKKEQSELLTQKTEWPRHYQPLDYFHSQEAFDKAKMGWMDTGKVYHLLSRDEENNPIIKEYPEYFDGEHRFIVVKEYDTFELRPVEPVTWYRDNDGNLIFGSSDTMNMWADITDLPQNLGQTKFREDVVKDYVQHIFTSEINADRKVEITYPVLMEELGRRNFDLQQKNEGLEKDKAKLTEDNAHFQQENEELKKKLQEKERENEELKKILQEKQKEEEALKAKSEQEKLAAINGANSKLAVLRKKVAKNLGVKTKLPKSLEKIEKAVSDAVLGKVRQ